MDCSLPGSSVHGILQARILEWVVLSSSRGSSRPRDWTRVSYIYLHWQAGSLPLAPPGKLHFSPYAADILESRMWLPWLLSLSMKVPLPKLNSWLSLGPGSSCEKRQDFHIVWTSGFPLVTSWAGPKSLYPELPSCQTCPCPPPRGLGLQSWLPAGERTLSPPNLIVRKKH